MKVAHLTTVDLSLRFLLFPQLEAVRNQGWEAVGISGDGPWVIDLESAGIRHLTLPGSTRSLSLRADLRAMVGLWRILKRERPDILHTHNPKPGVYGRILGRLVGVPIVVNTVHGLYATPDDPLMKRAMVYLAEAVASRFSHAELVQSREDMELMSRLRLARRRQMRHLGNGVDLARFDPERFSSAHRDRIRAQLGIRGDSVVVGIVGRLVREKGYVELFDAFAALDDRYSLVCVGPEDTEKDDALDRELIEDARGRGVVFTGMRSDVDEIYPAMDLFVLPSHREGFPRAAMEASAMGLPVVATDIRGCREVVEPQVNGLLVPVNDASALADAIDELGSDPARRTAMSTSARRLAMDRFDEREVVATVISTYRDLARRYGVGAVDPTGDVLLREATAVDALTIARLHRDSITTGFLPLLGTRFLTFLYRALISDPESDVFVADDDHGSVGFVAGTGDTSRFYRRFVSRWGLPAVIVALPRLAFPSVARRALETLRYGGSGSTTVAELLSMAVIEPARGRGLGRRLGEMFLKRMELRGCDMVRVVVSADNKTAIAAYERMGFGDPTAVQVHAGEPSIELTWRP